MINVLIRLKNEVGVLDSRALVADDEQDPRINKAVRELIKYYVWELGDSLTIEIDE